MAIIVTGASGGFGRQTAQLLMERVAPSELILVTRNPERLAGFAEKGADVRQGDFDDAEGLAAAFEGGEKMLLISTARVGGRVAQHRNAIEAAKAAGVRQVAYTSSAGISPDNPAIVIRDHTATEEMLRASGMAWTFLRDNHYAEAVATAIAPRAVATGAWIASAGDGRVGSVSRDDCAACAVAALTTPGHENQAYELTGPRTWSFREISQLLTQMTGRPVEYREVDDAGMFAMFDSLGIPRRPVDDQIVNDIPWCSDDMVTYERAIREGWFDLCTDNVQRLTGRPPRSLEEVLEAHRGLLEGA
jgi:NAD(P)H dehydrogenase (quinone)